MFRNPKAKIIALFTVIALTVSFSYLSAQTLNVYGTYKVTGTNPNGSKYKGSVTITLNEDGSYNFEWSVGNSFSGTGTLSGSTLTVDWGDTYPVIYTVKNGGNRLEGTWGNGTGTEILTK
ncbi:fibronectin-binding protein [Leptospira hartskeerlii]|uniref:Fibronectin-binding protein n=1 Tax=Leptospira hartskeerlii TaxID=2023177 RepID=A0A2M9XAN0_9LEPT|nr:fibronectin-binding protein [Leptospira hartskeerlii]PJZ24602.1 fibronectin-binding protein [Leptospira hartskeerlii]PJZ32785.1 fibronectin-binding protein [Leptospira hartskeerlii]